MEEAIKNSPTDVCGLEEIIIAAKEHIINGNKVELYHLRKLVQGINISDDYSSISVVFKYGYTSTYYIKYDRPPECSCLQIGLHDNGYTISGRQFTLKEGKRIVDCINRIKEFNNNLVVIANANNEGIIRIKNTVNKGRISWGIIKQ